MRQHGSDQRIPIRRNATSRPAWSHAHTSTGVDVLPVLPIANGHTVPAQNLDSRLEPSPIPIVSGERPTALDCLRLPKSTSCAGKTRAVEPVARTFWKNLPAEPPIPPAGHCLVRSGAPQAILVRPQSRMRLERHPGIDLFDRVAHGGQADLRDHLRSELDARERD